MHRSFGAILSALLLLVSVVVLAVPSSPVSVSDTDAKDRFHVMLDVVISFMPDDASLLATLLNSLPSAYDTAREQIRTRLARCRIDRLLYPDAKHDQFMKDLQRLLHDHAVPDKEMPNNERPNRALSNSAEIQLLQEIRSISNEILLAWKLSQALHFVQTHDDVFGAAIRFFTERCRYDSLPGYLQGFCIGHGLQPAGMDILRTCVVPYVCSISEQMIDTIRELSEGDDWLQTTYSDLLEVVPEQCRRYFVNGGRLYNFYHFGPPHLKQLPSRCQEFRGRYDLLRALLQLGIRLDMRVAVEWHNLKISELRELACFLSVYGFGRCLAETVARGQSDLVAELLRHPLIVSALSGFLTPYTMFLACQVAIRYGAPDVVRGLLRIPHAAEKLRKYWPAILDNPNRSNTIRDVDTQALLFALRPDFRPGKFLYEQSGFNHEPIEIDMNTLWAEIKDH